MTAYLLINHVLNLLAPAAAVAVLLVSVSRAKTLFSKRKVPRAKDLIALAAIIFAVNLMVLVAGLVVFGHDGKIATYAAMLVCAALALVASNSSPKGSVKR